MGKQRWLRCHRQATPICLLRRRLLHLPLGSLFKYFKSLLGNEIKCYFRVTSDLQFAKHLPNRASGFAVRLYTDLVTSRSVSSRLSSTGNSRSIQASHISLGREQLRSDGNCCQQRDENNKGSVWQQERSDDQSNEYFVCAAISSSSA